jgi:hypothetical protein
MQALIDSLQGRRRYPVDDPVAGYQPASDAADKPAPYMPMPKPGQSIQAIMDDIARKQREFHAPAPSMPERLGDIAAKTATKIGTVVKNLATAPINAVNRAYNQVANEQLPLSDADAPGGAASSPAIPEAALNVMGAGVPLAKPGALGAAGGKLIMSSAERATVPQRKVGLDTVGNYLEANAIPHRRDVSNSPGSLSTYYYVNTPGGVKKIRVSDHIGNVGEDISIPLGSDANAAFQKIGGVIGKPHSEPMAVAADQVLTNKLRQNISDMEAAKAAKKYDQYGPYDYDSAIKRLSAKLKEIDPAKESLAPFYSALDNALINAKQERAQPGEWLGPRTERKYTQKDPKTGKETPAVDVKYGGILGNMPGVKPEELEATGIPAFLAEQKGAVTKEQLREHALANQVQLREVNKGGGSNQAVRFPQDQYQLLGASNYGETLLTLPLKQMELKLGEAEPIGKEYGNKEFSGRWQGGRVVEGVKDYPFEIGDQKGRITYWPQSFDNIGTPGPPKWIVNSNNLQNGYFNSLEQAKNAIQQSFEGSGMGGYMAKARGDIYRSSHWPDDPNTIVHVRHNDRELPGVGNALHLEEVQSDLHQTGRKQGYRDQPLTTRKQEGIPAHADPIYEAVDPGGAVRGRGYSPEEARSAAEGVALPNLPFKESWPDLALKRMLHKAATERNPDGSFRYHAMSWTPGEVQAARYNLSKHISHIDHIKNSENSFDIHAYDKSNNQVISREDVSANDIADIVGKDIADKIIKGDGKDVLGGDAARYAADAKRLSNVDLKVGGKGMKAFYDKMLVDKTNAALKEVGVKDRVKHIDANHPDTDISDEAFKSWISERYGRDYRSQLGRDEIDAIREDWEHQIGIPETKKLRMPIVYFTPENRAAIAKGFKLFGIPAAVGGTALNANQPQPQPLGDAAAKALATPPPRLPQ